MFYDYDGEPIYVAQSMEQVRTRIRRHLTNQRTDAVAMNLLDPFEFAELEVTIFELDLRLGEKKVQSEVYDRREHSNARITRRASAVADLAPVISKRDGSKGMRRTLLTQARRVEHLALGKLKELGINEDS